MAKIYLKLGLVQTDKFVVAKRKDLIGQYLGETTAKTTAVFKEAKNGVLFIDEAYSLGHSEKRDIYSKECLDVIVQNLEKGTDVVLIIAGYKEELEKCFFSSNEGLRRRFPWVYNIDPYSVDSIRSIFLKQVENSGWGFLDSIDEEAPLSFFQNHKDLFQFSGGDTDNFFNKCKIAHSKRIFLRSNTKRGKLIHIDLKKAIDMHKENNKIEKNEPPFGMYL